MKIYIAGKIGYLPVEVYTTLFKNAQIAHENLGYTVVNPVDLPHKHERTWKVYMREDLKEVKTCDAIYMLNNWIDSRGARIEHWFAKRYNLKVIYQRGGIGL